MFMVISKHSLFQEEYFLLLQQMAKFEKLVLYLRHHKKTSVHCLRDTNSGPRPGTMLPVDLACNKILNVNSSFQYVKVHFDTTK